MEEHTIQCPYCGESLSILIDPSVRNQQYVEDCQVCCSPMVLTVRLDDAAATIDARQES